MPCTHPEQPSSRHRRSLQCCFVVPPAMLPHYSFVTASTRYHQFADQTVCYSA
jgi:hypothetical protein